MARYNLHDSFDNDNRPPWWLFVLLAVTIGGIGAGLQQCQRPAPDNPPTVPAPPPTPPSTIPKL
ncbi:hypothetical protein LJ737_17550 [Hymenobacter sp. 15J16-1T3B]|uniref:hypothetical protein n=1 Tax=Hymenobacter sp. 15J16-1T3B TaxID=2886941 RepID=UPI001D12889A|nr:hypothetical protein [Hymenobacter sp. 15J16-1T3B]MCC3159052.1 hypothetical protein [Hymenobacter sp. 15J16-1T3B]